MNQQTNADSLSSIQIAYEDKFLLVVVKPSGLPTQGTLDPKRANLYSLLLASKRWPYLGLHHRLDTSTSGLVLFTKDRRANKGISDLFKGVDKNTKIEKTYFCVCRGVPTENHFVVENYLRAIKISGQKNKMRSVNSGGDRALTRFTLLEQNQTFSLLKAEPETGRMHQIRVHLAELGFPILGDTLYGKFDKRFPRLYLHAGQLRLPHPIEATKALLIKSELPPEFRSCLQK